jgi:nicotinic acid mononucleotide adenylyltransferase
MVIYTLEHVLINFLKIEKLGELLKKVNFLQILILKQKLVKNIEINTVIKTQYAKDKANNPEKVKERKRISSKKSVQNLVNSVVKRYIAREYVDINYSEVPQELVELKRKQLTLTRTIRNNGN